MTNTEPIVILGVGMTPVGEHWQLSLRTLALQAMDKALGEARDLRPQALYVANMLAPSLSGQAHLGALLADFAGMRGMEAVTVEAAGASGGLALRQGCLALAAGAHDVALVVGIEKVTDHVGSGLEAALMASGDSDYEAAHGLTPTALAALRMRRYLHEAGAPPDALAGFSRAAHAHAVANPYAIYRKAISVDDYRKAPMVSEPVNLYDAAPMADGAAALLVARVSALKGNYPNPVAVRGIGVATSSVALHEMRDPLDLPAARLSAERAYAQASFGPGDVDLFEAHDAFTIYAALAVEAAGFAKRGQGWRLAAEGRIDPGGTLPMLTFGGSKARGDSGGATGVYQIAEVVLQLQGRADGNQVPGARRGMAQCLGGSGGTAVTTMLEAA
ncbi:MAG TPA: thiolase domain-containing protein [Anaerolineales bacterium]|nr:thiolase domain-containing protein [Anaerolineales bacterium]